MAMLFSWAMSGLGQCAPAIPPKVRAVAVEPVQNVLFGEPNQLPDLDVRQARLPQPLHMPLGAAEKSCQFLGGHQRPFFRGFLSSVVACRHTMHLGVNARPVQSLPVAVREWKSTFSTSSKLPLSSRYFERRSLVISVLLLRRMGGLPEQKSVKLKNVSSWDFTGGLPTLGHERLT